MSKAIGDYIHRAKTNGSAFFTGIFTNDETTAIRRRVAEDLAGDTGRIVLFATAKMTERDGEPYCNHDEAAQREITVSICECGEIVSTDL